MSQDLQRAASLDDLELPLRDLFRQRELLAVNLHDLQVYFVKFDRGGQRIGSNKLDVLFLRLAQLEVLQLQVMFQGCQCQLLVDLKAIDGEFLEADEHLEEREMGSRSHLLVDVDEFELAQHIHVEQLRRHPRQLLNEVQLR